MYISTSAIKLVQTSLKERGAYKKRIDGDLGPSTEKALDLVLSNNIERIFEEERQEILTGSRRRKLTAWLQIMAEDAGIDTGRIDGYWGPQTDYAYDSLLHLQDYGVLPDDWRDENGTTRNPNNWPNQNHKDLVKFYGKPGPKHLVIVDLPYPHRLAWDLNTVVRRTRCHKKVADSCIRVLNDVISVYGMDRIRKLRLDHYGGGYNYRSMRGGSSWSTHAWGIAFDYDPSNNKLRWGRDRAAFARPDYDDWWDCWEKEGWVSLGRAKNYDWMHVQAAIK